MADGDHMDRFAEARRPLGQWFTDGSIQIEGEDLWLEVRPAPSSAARGQPAALVHGSESETDPPAPPEDHATLQLSGIPGKTSRLRIPVPLPHGPRRCRTQPGVAAWWNQDSHCLAVAPHLSRLIDALSIVGTIRTEGRHSPIGLLEQGGNPSAVLGAATGQVGGDDLTGIRIDGQVQLPPSPLLGRLAEMTDVDSDARAVDEQMQRPVGRERVDLDLARPL